MKTRRRDRRPLPILHPRIRFNRSVEAARVECWISALMKSRQSGAAFARGVFRDEILPVLRTFSIDCVNELAEESQLAFFGDDVPRLKIVRVFDLFAEALVHPDYMVRIHEGSIEFGHTLRPAPKRSALRKLIAEKVDDHFRIVQFRMEKTVDGHFRVIGAGVRT